MFFLKISAYYILHLKNRRPFGKVACLSDKDWSYFTSSSWRPHCRLCLSLLPYTHRVIAVQYDVPQDNYNGRKVAFITDCLNIKGVDNPEFELIHERFGLAKECMAFMLKRSSTEL